MLLINGNKYELIRNNYVEMHLFLIEKKNAAVPTEWDCSF